MSIYHDIVDLHYDGEETSKEGSIQVSHRTKPQIVFLKAKKKISTCFAHEVARNVRMNNDIWPFFSKKMLTRENHWQRRKQVIKFNFLNEYTQKLNEKNLPIITSVIKQKQKDKKLNIFQGI